MFIPFTLPRHLQATELGSLVLAVCMSRLSRTSMELEVLGALSVENNVDPLPWVSNKNYLHPY